MSRSLNTMPVSMQVEIRDEYDPVFGGMWSKMGSWVKAQNRRDRRLAKESLRRGDFDAVIVPSPRKFHLL